MRNSFLLSLLLRRQPTSTLFPTRRSSDLSSVAEATRRLPAIRPEVLVVDLQLHLGADRSEEHTSELQSRGHLVCRLLLEKKKNVQTTGQEREHSAGGCKHSSCTHNDIIDA